MYIDLKSVRYQVYYFTMLTRSLCLHFRKYLFRKNTVKILVVFIFILISTCNMLYLLPKLLVRVDLSGKKTLFNKLFNRSVNKGSETPCNLERFFKMPYPNNTLNNIAPGEKKYLIYSCRGKCGGFADQLKGITTSYALAKRSGRALRIQETVKCGITTYLKPKKYNWTYDQNEVGDLLSTYCNTINAKKTWNIKINDYVLYLNESVVYLQTNRIYGDRDTEYKRTFKSMYNELFDLKKGVKHDFDSFVETYVKGNKTVCAHLRVGKSRRFVDSTYNNLGNISGIWKFLSQYDRPGFVIYVATDSAIVREAARRRFPSRFIDMPGRVINTAFEMDDASCSGFRKNMLDFSFLTRCDILLLTFSDFGFHASLLKETESDQYCYQAGKVYPCPFYSIIRKRSKDNLHPLLNVR